MEKENFLPDDFLKDLFRNQSWENPGDDFTDNVMEQILKSPDIAPVRKPFFLILRSSWPYILLFLITVVVFMTSDLPFSNYIPGKEYFIKNFIPAFNSLFSGLKPMFTNVKMFMIPVTVIIAGSLLVGFDHFLFRKPGVRHQTTH
jgi:hypothetical protein